VISRKNVFLLGPGRPTGGTGHRLFSVTRLGQDLDGGAPRGGVRRTSAVQVCVLRLGLAVPHGALPLARALRDLRHPVGRLARRAQPILRVVTHDLRNRRRRGQRAVRADEM
jgi:hypothetical protein